MNIKKKNNFLKLIYLCGVFFIVTITVSITIYEVVKSHKDFNSQAELIRNNYVSQQQQIIKREVDRIVERIQYVKAKSEDITKAKVKSRVYEADAIARHIYEQNQNTKSILEIKQMILTALRPILFEQGNGYYFISRHDGVAQLLPNNPELEGLKLLDLQDTQGQYIIKDMIQIIKQSGEGFYQYYWGKPEKPGHSFKKISFIKEFKPCNWVIGAGLYVDDIEVGIKKELLLNISTIRFGKEGYLFVNNLNGDALVSNGKLIQGTKKLWEVFNKNPEKIKELFKKEYNAAIKLKGDFIYYSLSKLTSPDKETAKVSFISGVPGMDWIIGAGVYIDDVETNIDVIYTKRHKQIKKKVLVSSLIILGIGAFFLYVASWLTRKLQNDFNQFYSFFNKAASSDEKIDLSLINFNELELMAKHANKMVEDKFHAQQNLIDEKERLAITIHSIGDGVITTDTSGKVELINKVAQQLTGWKADKAHGKALRDIFNIINAKTLEKVENPAEQVLINKKTVILANHTILKSKDGSEYQIADSAAPIKDTNGKITGVVLVFRDVTKEQRMRENLKQSEAKSLAILNAIPDLIFILNRDSIFLDYHVSNPDDMFMRPEEFIGKELQDVLPDSVSVPLMTVFKHALSTNQIQRYEYSLQINDQTKHFIIRILPYGEDQVLSIISNITESKRIEKDLLQIERIKSIGTLAGGIAHDFNNVLTGIYGNISIAKKTIAKDHPAYKFLEKLGTSMSRATSLTNKLLTFAKGGSPVTKNICIGSLLKEVISFDLSGCNIKPVFNQAENLWLADVDKGQIQQVFSNLAINARQAMPYGGHLYVDINNIDMTIEPLHGLQPNKYLEIVIRDEGYGINSKNLNRIFDPYFTTKEDGSGLGLAISYSIINKHKGFITLDTKVGVGTTFMIYLPASEANKIQTEEQGIKEALNRVQKAKVQTTKARKAKILLMDDEKIICEVVSQMIETIGHSVEVAFNGKKAIEMYKDSMDKNRSFDVVIMDLTIPGGIGGKEAIKNLLDIDPAAKVIVSSGYADDPVMTNYAHYGFKNIIPKPFTIKNLQMALDKIL
ncbi:cache domain-containing protein [bacterium]|nr:cache domain-containing protein [bacterium]